MPRLNSRFQLNFYGGEPLLSFDVIRDVTALAEERAPELGKHASFSITTNGSLMTGRVIRFFRRHRFSVTLSFDGTAQDRQRRPGSSARLIERIRTLAEDRDIRLSTNSVFTPRTVGCLGDSVQKLLGLGVPDVHFALSVIEPWDGRALRRLERELAGLAGGLLAYQRRRGTIPVAAFREKPARGVFRCAAGREWMAVAADGTVWGCYLFADLFRDKAGAPDAARYCFGRLKDLESGRSSAHPRVLRHYRRLRQDRFSTARGSCLLCPDLEECAVCPVNTALAGFPLGEIPDFMCEIQRIKNASIEEFRKQLENRSMNSRELVPARRSKK